MNVEKITESLQKITAEMNTIVSLLKNEASAEATTPQPEEAPSDITFEEVRGALAEKASSGCRQQVKDLLKEYSLSCLSDISKHPALFSEILEKARLMS